MYFAGVSVGVGLEIVPSDPQPRQDLTHQQASTAGLGILGQGCRCLHNITSARLQGYIQLCDQHACICNTYTHVHTYTHAHTLRPEYGNPGLRLHLMYKVMPVFRGTAQISVFLPKIDISCQNFNKYPGEATDTYPPAPLGLRLYGLVIYGPLWASSLGFSLVLCGPPLWASVLSSVGLHSGGQSCPLWAIAGLHSGLQSCPLWAIVGLHSVLQSCPLWVIVGLHSGLQSCPLWAIVGLHSGLQSCPLWAIVGLQSGLQSCPLWAIVGLHSGLQSCPLWAIAGLHSGLQSCPLGHCGPPLWASVLSSVGHCGPPLWASVLSSVGHCGPPVWASVLSSVGHCGPPVWSSVLSSGSLRASTLVFSLVLWVIAGLHYGLQSCPLWAIVGLHSGQRHSNVIVNRSLSGLRSCPGPFHVSYAYMFTTKFILLFLLVTFRWYPFLHEKVH